jgi:hypothetical protein
LQFFPITIQVILYKKISDYSYELTSQISNGASISLKRIENDCIDISYNENVQKLLSTDSLSSSDIHNLKDEVIDKMINEMSGQNFWFVINKNSEEEKENGIKMNLRKGGDGFVIAKKVITENNDELGYIFIIRLNEDYILKIFEEINIGSDTEIFILSSDGTIVSSRNDNYKVGININNKDIINNNKEITNTSWHTVTLIPKEFFYKDSITMRNIILSISILCIVTAVILSKNAEYPHPLRWGMNAEQCKCNTFTSKALTRTLRDLYYNITQTSNL